MKHFIKILWLGAILISLIACSSSGSSKLDQWDIPDTDFPLGEPSPYSIGVTELTLVDKSRGGRIIEVKIWYPANEETDALSMKDAPANKQDALYPMILTGYATGSSIFKEHLASHGFVMVEVVYPEEYTNWDVGILDHPQDMLFALKEMDSSPPNFLSSIIDTDRVGVTGYSWEGFYTLMLSGARIDPEHYLSYCQQTPEMQPKLEDWYLRYTCTLSENWDEFAAHFGNQNTNTSDDLWFPTSDSRIKALAPMGPEGFWMFGGRGLATVDRPLLIIAGTADVTNPYNLEAVQLFKNLDTPDKVMVSFVDKTHFMVEKPDEIVRMNHFITAFFGFHLQGRDDLAYYFSEDFVTQFDDLAWGIYFDD